MAKKKTNGKHLSPGEIEKFKTILLAKRNEILGDVSTMEAEALRKVRSDLSSMPIHMADLGTDNYEVENTLGLMDSERKILVDIYDAILRVEEGTYGICQGNGEVISRERLEAIPWAKYCVECAIMLEKGTLRNNSNSSDANYDYGDDEQDGDPEEPLRREAI